MQQGRHYTHKRFLLGVHTFLVSVVRNKRKVMLGLTGAYLVAFALLATVLLQSPQSNNPTFAASEGVAAILTSTTQTASLGTPVTLELDIQNIAPVGVLSDVTIELLSTDNQIQWKQAVYGDTNRTLTIQNSSFSLPLLSAQTAKKIKIEGTVTALSKPYLAVTALLSSENKLSVATNRVFIPTSFSTIEQQQVLLATKTPTRNAGESIDLTVQVSELADSEVNGEVLLLKHGEIVERVSCVISAGKPCLLTFKNLQAGNHQIWFYSEETGVFSNLITLPVQANGTGTPPAATATMRLPFGTTSIGGTLPVVIQNVVTRNQKPIVCTLELENKLSQEKKQFLTQSNESRMCVYWLKTSDMPTFGEYALSVLGTELKEAVFLLDETSTLPLSIDTTLLGKNLPLSIESKDVQTLLEPKEPFQNNAELLIYSLQSNTLTKEVKDKSDDQIAYTAGVLSASITSKSFEDGNSFLVALTAKEIDGTKTHIRYSDWKSVNFVTDVVAVPNTGITVKNTSELNVGAQPVFEISDIRDGNNFLVDGKSCVMTLHQAGKQAVNVSGVIQQGVCSLITPKDFGLTTGNLLVSFYTQDLKTSIPVSKVFQINSTKVQSLGGVAFAQAPIVRGKSTTLYLGPVKDSQDNLVTSARLTVQLGIVEGRYLEQKTVWVENGFGTLLVPASSVDAGTVFVAVQNDTGETVFTTNVPTIEKNPLSLKNSSDTLAEKALAVQASGISDKVNECVFRFKNTEQIEVTAPFDISNGTCTASITPTKLSSSQALLEVATVDGTVTQLLTLKSGPAVQNFSLYPNTRIQPKNGTALSFVTSPIVDTLGLPVQSSNLELKMNGKKLKGSVLNGIGTIVLQTSDVEDSDFRSIFQTKTLDVDIEGGVNARAQITTTNLQIALGQREVTEQTSLVETLDLASTYPTGTMQLARFQTDVCEAELEQQGILTKLLSVQKESECFVFLAGLEGKAILRLESGGVVGLEKTIQFISQVPRLVLSKQEGLKGRVVGSNGILTAQLLDQEKVSEFVADEEGELRVSVQEVSKNLRYTVLFLFEDTDGQLHTWTKTFFGSEF